MNPKRPKINDTSIGLGNSIMESTNGGDTNASKRNQPIRSMRKDKQSN
jgi:hypothetical protein